jgi:60 kDa SS-A/Ro ribonucleoprotein
MAITLARCEPHSTVVQFDTQVRGVLPVTKRTTITSIDNATGVATDVASPVIWAMGQGEHFDAFIVLTDDETWAGSMHPSQALEAYRRQVNAKVKLVCCSMAANHASVVDPLDGLSLGCAGLDANLPSIVANFIGTELTSHD